MFYYVSGTVAETEANLAVIDCGGVGYACATTNYTLSQLKKGAQAKLYTYLNVREDAMELFWRISDCVTPRSKSISHEGSCCSIFCASSRSIMMSESGSMLL